MPLSRMHDELFLKDTRYACDYWEEHRANFEAMLNDLLVEESLLKILQVSKETSLMFNDKTGAVSKEDNEKLVRAAYDRLELLISPERKFTPSGEKEASFNGKMFLFDGMVNYFQILNQVREDAGKPLSIVFLEHIDQMKTFLEPLLPDGYTLEEACKTFSPQLSVYFYYIVWKYDQALEGKLVSEYLEGFRKQKVFFHFFTPYGLYINNGKEKMSSPENIEEIWTSVHGREEVEDDGIKIEEPEGEIKNAGQKNEAWIFQQSSSKQRDAVEGYWTRKGSEIRTIYENKSQEEQRDLFADVRNIITSMGNSSYQNAIMYCPELNPEKLCGLDTKKAPFCVYSFYELVESTRKQKELPKITPKNQQEIIEAICHESYGDPFIFTVSKRLASSQKLLPLVALSRQHLLFVFCHMVFVRLLGLPLQTVTDTIPGCSDDDKIPTSFPFSTREQREATPIGKPPVPGLMKKPVPKVEEVVGEEEQTTSTTPCCSEPTCKKPQGKDIKFQVCSFCKKNQKSILYCSRDCQIKHWRSGHKSECFKNAH